MDLAICVGAAFILVVFAYAIGELVGKLPKK